MTYFEERGCEIQYDSESAESAVANFEKSCNKCVCRAGVWISCDRCAIRFAHELMMNNVFNSRAVARA